MINLIYEALRETAKIGIIVFFLMVIIEFLEIRYKDKIKRAITKKPLRQYIMSSALGIVPGCVDAFFVVSLYVSGLVSFGALAAVMISTAGDEAFVMLAMIPDAALAIFGACFVLGILGGFLADKIVKRLKLRLCEKCRVELHKNKEKSIVSRHFLKEHIYEHIIKKHMTRLLVWLFFTILVINMLMQSISLEAIIPQNMVLLLLAAALIGILPESGPHLIFVVMFSKGLIPFSVLLTSSLVQDGHGIIPLLSYSIKDAAYVKIFNVLFGLLIGLLLMSIGL